MATNVSLEQEIARLKAELADSRTELEAVNNSTHLGIWKCFYDEAGNQAAVEYSDEFRRMLGYSKAELPDTLDALGKVMHQDDAPAVFACFGAAAKRTFKVRYRLSSAYKEGWI